MRIARLILRIVGLSLSLAGMICMLIGFWDQIFSVQDPYYEF